MTTMIEFTLFDTAIGRCGMAWSRRGVVRVQLPGTREGETSARLARHCPGAVEAAAPARIEPAIEGIVALLGGGRRDLSWALLDLEGVPLFHRRVYEVVREIPPGWLLTYGEVAARLGLPGSARAVGQALGRNPVAILVPCHRVVAAGGRAGGFSAGAGVATKRRLLAIEGACRPREPDLFDGLDAVRPGSP